MNSFKKSILVALVAALAVAALPMASVFAQEQNPPKGEVTNEKLEQIWAKQLKAYERLGKAFDTNNDRFAKAQEMIDTAKANGKDVTAVQSALDAFEAALKSAQPTYESMKGIVNSHQGFDANGKVTDAEKAQSTVKEMRTKMQEVKSTLNGTGKALREAIKAFREANKPAESAGKDS
jgi:hypothetical protein